MSKDQPKKGKALPFPVKDKRKTPDRLLPRGKRSQRYPMSRRPGDPPPPTKADRQARFLKAYLKYGTVYRAAKIAKISRATHRAWLDRDPEYAQRFFEVHESAVDMAEAELRRRGIVGVDEPIFYQGEQVATVKRYSDACLIFYLKGRRGDVFRERSEISGPGGGPIQSVDLSLLTVTQLEQMRKWLTEAQERAGGQLVLPPGTPQSTDEE